MIDFIKTTKMTDRSVVASCLLGSRVDGTGLSRVVSAADARPAALEVAAAAAPAPAYALALTAAGIGDGSQKKHNLMWAFRGLEPWRDPA